MPQSASQPARPRPVPAAPDDASLHEAALRHLARYACPVAGLIRVLDRRVDRWARAAGPGPEQIAAARQAVRAVVARLRAAGALDDAGFAQARARTLARAGSSRRAIATHLAQRGVGRDLAEAALPQSPEHELAAALMLARRRRIGPFRGSGEADPTMRRRELATLARAGFAEAVARRVLATDREAAESLLLRLRRDR